MCLTFHTELSASCGINPHFLQLEVLVLSVLMTLRGLLIGTLDILVIRWFASAPEAAHHAAKILYEERFQRWRRCADYTELGLRDGPTPQ